MNMFPIICVMCSLVSLASTSTTSDPLMDKYKYVDKYEGSYMNFSVVHVDPVHKVHSKIFECPQANFSSCNKLMQETVSEMTTPPIYITTPSRVTGHDVHYTDSDSGTSSTNSQDPRLSLIVNPETLINICKNYKGIYQCIEEQIETCPAMKFTFITTGISLEKSQKSFKKFCEGNDLQTYKNNKDCLNTKKKEFLRCNSKFSDELLNVSTAVYQNVSAAIARNVQYYLNLTSEGKVDDILKDLTPIYRSIIPTACDISSKLNECLIKIGKTCSEKLSEAMTNFLYSTLESSCTGASGKSNYFTEKDTSSTGTLKICNHALEILMFVSITISKIMFH